jgi:uncharacterized protein involved in exopolysaccharide biosynthesis
MSQQPESPTFAPEVNGAPVILTILRGWRILLVLALLGAIYGYYQSSKEVPIYRAESVVWLPPSSSPSAAASLLPGAAAGSPGDTLTGIINSKTMNDTVAKKLGIKPKDLKIGGSFDPKVSQIQVRAEAKSKELAVKTVQTVLTTLREIRLEMTQQTYEQQAKLVDKAIADKEAEIMEAQTALARLASNMKVIPDPNNPSSMFTTGGNLARVTQELKKTNLELSQMKAETDRLLTAAKTLPIDHPVGALRQRVNEKALELKNLRIQLAETAPQVVLAKRQLDELEKQFNEELSKYIRANDLNLSQRAIELSTRKLLLESDKQFYEDLAKTAPEDSARYTTLMTKVTSMQAQLASLKQQSNQLMVTLKVDPIAYAVLVPAFAEEAPINKAMGRSVTMYAFFGIMLGAGIVLVLNSVKGKGK